MATAYLLPNLDVSLSEDQSQGQSSEQYTMRFRVIRDTPNEFYSIQDVCGYDIGSPYPHSPNAYCVGIEDSADGDSRMSRIITVKFASPNFNDPAVTDEGWGYETSGGSGGTGLPIGTIPSRAQSPEVRPPTVGMDASVESIPTNYYISNPLGKYANPEQALRKTFAVQPTGEIIEGLERPDHQLILTATQFNMIDPAALVQYIGCVNEKAFKFQSLTCDPRTALLKSISGKPTVKTYLGRQFAGWDVTYTLAIRSNRQRVLANINEYGWATNDAQAEQVLGWDIAVPLRGNNIVMKFGPYKIDPWAYPLARTDANGVLLYNGTVAGHESKFVAIVMDHANLTYKYATLAGTYWPTATSLDVTKVAYGSVVRAQVQTPLSTGAMGQQDAAQPVPLNPDGTPRARYNPGANANDPQSITDPDDAVLSYRRGVYDQADFNALLGLRGITEQ